MVIQSAGNVGIGTDSPNEKLTVVGNISACNTVQACSVSANSTNGGFVSAGRDLADIFATSSGNVDGTGTANFLPVWSDTDTIGNSIACQSSTLLTVAGSISSQGYCSDNFCITSFFSILIPCCLLFSIPLSWRKKIF